MRNESSDSVRIFWYDRDKVRRALEKALRELVQAHPEVEEAILFGSFIRGDAVPGSDVDVILVLQSSPLSFLQRIPAYLPAAVPGGVDVFPYTRREFERMCSEGNFFVRRALSEGKRLSRAELLSGRALAA